MGVVDDRLIDGAFYPIKITFYVWAVLWKEGLCVKHALCSEGHVVCLSHCHGLRILALVVGLISIGCVYVY